MKTIFVSFDSQDREIAQIVVTGLRKFNPGITFFWAGDSLQGGKPWFPQITGYLQASSGIITLITSNASGTNNWLNFESGAAIGNGRPLLAVLAPGITISMDLSRPLQEVQLTTWSDREALGRELSVIGLCALPEAVEALVAAFTPFQIKSVRYGANDQFTDFTNEERKLFEDELENRKQIVIGNHLIGGRDPCRNTPKILFAEVLRNGIIYTISLPEGTVARRSSFYR